MVVDWIIFIVFPQVITESFFLNLCLYIWVSNWFHYINVGRTLLISVNWLGFFMCEVLRRKTFDVVKHLTIRQMSGHLFCRNFFTSVLFWHGCVWSDIKASSICLVIMCEKNIGIEKHELWIQHLGDSLGTVFWNI